MSKIKSNTARLTAAQNAINTAAAADKAVRDTAAAAAAAAAKLAEDNAAAAAAAALEMKKADLALEFKLATEDVREIQKAKKGKKVATEKTEVISTEPKEKKSVTDAKSMKDMGLMGKVEVGAKTQKAAFRDTFMADLEHDVSLYALALGKGDTKYTGEQDSKGKGTINKLKLVGISQITLTVGTGSGVSGWVMYDTIVHALYVGAGKAFADTSRKVKTVFFANVYTGEVYELTDKDAKLAVKDALQDRADTHKVSNLVRLAKDVISDKFNLDEELITMTPKQVSELLGFQSARVDAVKQNKDWTNILPEALATDVQAHLVARGEKQLEADKLVINLAVAGATADLREKLATASKRVKAVIADSDITKADLKFSKGQVSELREQLEQARAKITALEQAKAPKITLETRPTSRRPKAVATQN